MKRWSIVPDIKKYVLRANKMQLWSVTTHKILAVIGIEEFITLNESLSTQEKQALALISITEPNKPSTIEQHIVEDYSNVLHCQFWDLRKPMRKNGEVYPIITQEQGLEIKNFILENRDKKFLIHCKAGISRSAGVGMAIEALLCDAAFEIENSEIYNHKRYTPNLSVYEVITGATKK